MPKGQFLVNLTEQFFNSLVSRSFLRWKRCKIISGGPRFQRSSYKAVYFMYDYDFTVFFFQKIREKIEMTIEEGMIVEETIIVDTGIMMTVTEILKEIEVIVGKTGKSKLRVPEGKKTPMTMVILKLLI